VGPLVSICIPAYGRPRELGEAIESVLEQDHRDVEVVVGDDSGDLEEAARASGDPRVRYLRNERRLGMAGNWNAVLDASRGELVGLLMDDDRLLPGFLTAVVQTFEADPSAGVVFTDHVFQGPDGVTRRECALAEGRYPDFLPHLLDHKPVAVSAAVMRREVWEAVRPLPDLKTADVVMHVRAALAGAVFHYVDEPLMAYRRHPGQLSGELAFRDDVVAAWEQFSFEDAACERRRRKRLAAALVSRAGGRLREARYADALHDVERAHALGTGPRRPREHAIGALARHPALAATFMRALDRARLAGPRPGTAA
jgi:glycosyltransferase involved in cell wall biosynthesis